VILNGGKILINGNINGKMEISGADVTINGKIGKDVKISSSNIKIGDNAQISGNFSYTSGQEAVISPNAKISGKTSWTKTETGKGRDFKMTPDMKMGAFAAITATWLGGKAVSFLSFFILGLLLLRVIPKTFDKFSERMKKSPGICAGSGAIMVFGTPLGAFILIIVSILLFITLIGSGLGCLLIIADIAAMLFYSAVLFLSNIFLSFFIGRIILNKSMKNPDRYGWKVLAFLIGLVITSAVYAIPFAGWLAMFAGILFGSGGLIMIMKDWRSTHGKIQSS
jgi:hypothetical protein